MLKESVTAVQGHPMSFMLIGLPIESVYVTSY